jgi:hypothetical protein
MQDAFSAPLMGVFSLSPLSLFHTKKRKGVDQTEGLIEYNAHNAKVPLRSSPAGERTVTHIAITIGPSGLRAQRAKRSAGAQIYPPAKASPSAYP